MNRPSLRAVVVALIPFCAMCFSVSAWDRVYPMVLGLPFNFFWLLCWIVLTSVCMGIVYRIESARAAKPSRDPGERLP
ncbi:MAG TPA: DUF3311 domain-containing protein [Bryobacteraceae bacterium]|nr:DUF3311 domain-containing protein [Bryobacteraceae bacterium]